jgi:hypothetical protein
MPGPVVIPVAADMAAVTPHIAEDKLIFGFGKRRAT